MNRPEQSLRSEAAAPARFTAAEFLRMADLGAFDDMKVELDHGELVRMNPPFSAHAAAAGQVLAMLYRSIHSDEVAVVPEISLDLGGDTIRALDAAVVEARGLTEKVLKPEHVLLAVEVADSTLEKDLGEKLRDYAAAGIPLYWVVDVKARCVHVMGQPEGDAYGRREVVRFGEALDLPTGAGRAVLG